MPETKSESSDGRLHCVFSLYGGKLKSVHPAAEREIWPGLYARSLALTTGKAPGKSFLVLQQALALAIGGAPEQYAIDEIVEARPVLIALGCDSLAVIDDRVNRIAALWNLDDRQKSLAAKNLRIIDCGGRPDILDSDFRRAMELGAEGIGNCAPGMVVLDPLHHFVNLWNPEDRDKSVKALKGMAADLGCAVMGIGREMPDCRYVQELLPITREEAGKLAAICGLESRELARNCLRLAIGSNYAGHIMDHLLLRSAGGVLVPLRRMEPRARLEEDGAKPEAGAANENDGNN